jgi:hypothetical protein
VEDYLDYFNSSYPLALDTLKALSENLVRWKNGNN